MTGELHSTGAKWPPVNPRLPDESLLPVMQVLSVQPRAVDYAHLVGRYVRMERPPTEEEIRENPDVEAIGMECVVGQVSDCHDGVEVIAEYGYGFVVTADDAADWCFHVWSDQAVRELFATWGPMPMRRDQVVPGSVKAELTAIEDTLAAALGYEHTPEAGYVVGDHTALTLAQEAARRIEELTNELTEVVQSGGLIRDDD